MAPVGRQVSRLLRPAIASLLVYAALCAAPALAQFGSQPVPPPSNTTPLPATTEPTVQASLQVVDIQVEGNKKHSREAVLGAMNTRIGHAFDQDAFEKDIRKLTSRSWFVHVVPKKEYVPAGVIITLSVVERPTLEYVKFFGNEKVSTRKLEKEVALKKNDAFDPYAVRDAARKIESLYQAKGFSGVTVDIPEGTEPGDRGAVFLINEGKKLKFGDISFEGNSRDIAPDGRLKKIVQSREPILWIIKGEVDRPKLEADVERLTDYYRSLGFFAAVVGRRIRYNENEDKLYVVFHIYEGPRYNVRNISFMGNTVFPSEALMPNLRLKQGDAFDQSAMNKDIGMVKDLYGSNGYVFADAIADLRFDLEPGVVDIIYRTQEGQQYRIGDIKITIKGDNPHTKHSTILNRLDMRPGDIADIRKFRDSERRIQASGLFNVDPSKGDTPKVTFSPPEEFDEIADQSKKPRVSGRRTGNTDSFRGQSPDQGHSAPQTSPATMWSNGQPVRVNRTAAAPTSAAGAVKNSAPPAALPAARPAYPKPPANSILSPPPAPRETIRYQSPDPNGGYGGTKVNSISPGGAYYQNQPTQGGNTTAGYNQPVGAGGVPATPYASAAQYAEPEQDPLSNPGYPSSGGYTPRDFGSGGSLVPPSGDFMGGPEALPPNQPALPIDVTASEAQTGRFMLGAGINSNAGVVGSIILDEQNFDWRRFPTSWEDFRSGRAFRGAGQKFRIEAAPGTVVQRYLINFSEPFFLDTPVSFGLSGYYFNRYYQDWMEQRTGGRVTLGYQFTPDFSGNIGLRAEDVYLDPTTKGVKAIEDAAGHSQLYSVRTSVAHDTRDSTFIPTEGHYITATFEYFMGTYFYPWVGLNTQKHWLLKQRPDGTGRHTFSFYNQFGVTGSDTPVYERFFAGGFSTLRGFIFRGASPTDPSTIDPSKLAVVGGDFQFLNSLEYMFPITADDSLKMVAFVDFGTVTPSINDIDWSGFRIAPGVGIRVTIPAISAAPIAIDFASPIQRTDGDQIQNISFFVGVGR